MSVDFMNATDKSALREPLKKRVGGSLANLDPLERLEMLRANARALLGDKRPRQDDGTLVRKVVGKAR
jgi:hypothetical protein